MPPLTSNPFAYISKPTYHQSSGRSNKLDNTESFNDITSISAHYAESYKSKKKTKKKSLLLSYNHNPKEEISGSHCCGHRQLAATGSVIGLAFNS